MLFQLSHSSSEGDFKPCLWRKIMGSGENGVRKVLTMWKVGISLFTCWGLPFQTTSKLRNCCCTLTSLQGIPSACRDTLTFTVTQSHHGDGSNNTGSLCGGSVCVVTQDAHRINLRMFRNQTQFSEHSVYVPAVGERECCLQTACCS